MYRDEVIALLRAHREEILALGVKSLGIFGSVARGEERPDSNVDLLVEFEGTPTFTIYTNVLFLLEDLLGRKVDLVPRSALKPRVRPYVERDLLEVA
jgi:uncharacterized protein